MPKNIQSSQYWPILILLGSAAKSQHYHTLKLLTKSFQQVIIEHLVTQGIDTISYFADLKENCTMISIVMNCAKLTINKAETLHLLLQQV